MVNIDNNILVRANGRSIDPAFFFVFNYTYNNCIKVPIRITGSLHLEDDKISDLLWEETSSHPGEEYFKTNEAGKGIKVEKVILNAQLSRLSLNRFEDFRKKNKKGDLALNLKLCITVLEPDFFVYSHKGVIGQQIFDLPALHNQSLFRMKSYNFSKQVIISSSDWIHDFCPQLNNKRYLVFEIPEPKTIKNKYRKKLNEAIASLTYMSEARLECDWNKVIEKSRPVWELIRNDAEIKKLLISDGLNEETIISYNKLVASLFDFSSKFIHRISKSATKDLMIQNAASKEDAELIYSISFSIVSMLSRKTI